ncbi:MAG TPA: uroporphyrinogen decarboxylase [Bacteroidia bacterium]|nr:uroporphyrinogen decarboxylase [Bacteroidia bacterium]
MQNDLLLKAARGEGTKRVPVWLMRQAGRILPGYRKVRASVKDFTELVKTPELACEVTLEPVNVLGVDAAIIFSDILVIPEAMGLPYEMLESKGPHFEKTIKSAKDIEALRIGTTENWDYVVNALKLTRKELGDKLPLLGFAGSPWTIFAYMTEGSGSKTFSVAKRMIFSEPALAHKLLEKITETTIHYLKDQVKAGADLVQIFDSWGGILGYDTYYEFSLKYIALIVDELSPLVPVTAFPKGAYFASEQLAKLNCRVIGLDWAINPVEARKIFGNKTLQGNMDPCLLYSDVASIRKATHTMIKSFGTQGYIANLGHGVYPDTPVDHVKCFVDAVKEYNAQ